MREQSAVHRSIYAAKRKRTFIFTVAVRGTEHSMAIQKNSDLRAVVDVILWRGVGISTNDFLFVYNCLSKYKIYGIKLYIGRKYILFPTPSINCNLNCPRNKRSRRQRSIYSEARDTCVHTSMLADGGLKPTCDKTYLFLLIFSWWILVKYN